MGNFYSNIALRNVARERVIETLRSMHRQAFVSPAQQGFVVVYDAESDEGDTEVNRQVARGLSERLGCVALAAMNHDDDVLCLALCRQGEVVDEYVSAPDYFDGGEESSDPSGGDARMFAELFGVPDSGRRIEEILRKTSDDYVFAVERHEALAATLKLPAELVVIGQAYIHRGELPDGFDVGDFEKVGE